MVSSRPVRLLAHCLPAASALLCTLGCTRVVNSEMYHPWSRTIQGLRDVRDKFSWAVEAGYTGHLDAFDHADMLARLEKKGFLREQHEWSLIDGWGNAFRYERRTVEQKEGACHVCRVLSAGENGIFENGLEDDMGFEVTIKGRRIEEVKEFHLGAPSEWVHKRRWSHIPFVIAGLGAVFVVLLVFLRRAFGRKTVM